MIKTASDFTNALDYLKKENNNYPSILTERMDSYEFNNSMKIIESQLNNLYEKIRITEDLKNYCKTYIINQIQLKEQQFKEKLKIIEDISNQYRDTEYISYTVSTNDNSEIIKDRDGSIINNMIIEDNLLKQSSNLIQKAKLSSIDFKTDNECYSNTAQNLIDNNIGSRSYYIVNEPIYNGIDEIYTILFSRSYECNYIDLKLSNCIIKECKIIANDNTEKKVKINTIFNKTKIKGIKLIINSSQYEYVNIKELSLKQDGYNIFNTAQEVINNTLKTEDIIINKEKQRANNTIEDYNKEYKQHIKSIKQVNNRNLLNI